jgi:predicted CXXCH cytochrome family protein
VLPPLSRTVVEFSVRATVDAAYLAAYEFRLTDMGETFAGAAEARVVLEAAPALELSPGQRVGVPAGDRRDAALTPIRFELTGSSPMTSSGGSGSTAASSTGDDQPMLRFALVPPPDAISAAWVAEPIHGPSTSLIADSCAACHRNHAAAGTLLTTGTPPQLGQCSSCHDGVTAPDVTAGYAAAPANDPADRAYYRHEPTAFAGHLSATDDGFAGQLNRHNECADCHNPHNSTSTPSAAGPAGWTGSGRVAGASSVTPTYGAPSGPTYALVSSTAFEYQLCLKCHSGYTQLPSNAGLPPSRFALDKGVEFDPASLSYHPVEAAGTNDTPAMEASLNGLSPYKLWSFTPDSTIRCVNCHADSRALAEPTPVPADANLPVHASANRGILLAGYKDRQLKAPIAAYTAADFALCYLCHAEAPFRDTTGDERMDTNFRYHGVHVSGANLLDHGSPGTDIDTASDGGGLATCAECHFRIHSTSFAVNGQPAGSRLVNFAPNVIAPTAGTITWRQKSATLAGTCAVKCHGQPHSDDY